MKRTVALIALTALLALSAPAARASAPDTFAQKYGLLVHQGNQQKPLPQEKAVEVITRFFNAEFKGKKFTRRISADEFRTLFFEMRRLAGGEDLAQKYPKISDPALRARIEARRQGWNLEDPVDYRGALEFLYAYSASAANGGRPYFKGLMVSRDDIDARWFADDKEIEQARQNLFGALQHEKSDLAHLSRLHTYLNAFKTLQALKNEREKPQNMIAGLPPELEKSIADLELSDVLGEASLTYAGQPDYRKHNLAAGLLRLNGKILQPGETLDYLSVLGISGYKKGLTIQGGKEVWEYGGGLCGAASLLYQAALRSGLEIVERHAHTIFYAHLYDAASIGLEASIFRPAKNLKIKNDSGHPLVFYAANDQKSQTLSIYIIGKKRYRQVTLVGPTAGKAREWTWVRQREEFNGKIISETLTTRYDSVR